MRPQGVLCPGFAWRGAGRRSLCLGHCREDTWKAGLWVPREHGLLPGLPGRRLHRRRARKGPPPARSASASRSMAFGDGDRRDGQWEALAEVDRDEVAARALHACGSEAEKVRIKEVTKQQQTRVSCEREGLSGRRLDVWVVLRRELWAGVVFWDVAPGTGSWSWRQARRGQGGTSGGRREGLLVKEV